MQSFVQCFNCPKQLDWGVDWGVSLARSKGLALWNVLQVYYLSYLVGKRQ